MSYSRILCCSAALLFSLTACSAEVISNVLGPVIEDLLPSDSGAPSGSATNSTEGSGAETVSGSGANALSNGIVGQAATGIFIVNQQQEESQARPALALNTQGDFVVVWSGYDDETVRSNNSIFARRFNANGAPLGQEFRVNTEHIGSQNFPDVALNDAGDFVVVWTQTNGSPVHAQAFDAQGQRVGQEFIVNDSAVSPAVAMNARGEFVVVWASNQKDSSDWDVFAQKFSATGSAQGRAFQVNSLDEGSQQDPAIAMNDAGEFVISWKASFQDERKDAADIFMRRFSASAQPQGPEVLVNRFTDDQQTEPTIAMNNAGQCVVAWESWRQEEKIGGEDKGVFAQAFDASGQRQGQEIHVNTYMTNDQDEPDVAMDDQGNFVVTWESFKQDGDNEGVYAQRFNAGGSKLGAEWKLDKISKSIQSDAKVAMNEKGAFIFSWSSVGYSTERAEIVAQRYASNGNAL